MPFSHVTLARKMYAKESPVLPCLFCDRFVFSYFISCRQAGFANRSFVCLGPQPADRHRDEKSHPKITGSFTRSSRRCFWFRHITVFLVCYAALWRFSKRVPFPSRRRSVFFVSTITDFSNEQYRPGDNFFFETSSKVGFRRRGMLRDDECSQVTSAGNALSKIDFWTRLRETNGFSLNIAKLLFVHSWRLAISFLYFKNVSPRFSEKSPRLMFFDSYGNYDVSNSWKCFCAQFLTAWYIRLKQKPIKTSSRATIMLSLTSIVSLNFNKNFCSN